MEDRRKHIDDLFREGLSDYRETPPASVWTSLEQRLPDSDEPNRKWLWYLLFLLLFGTAGYFISTHITDTPSKKATKELASVSEQSDNTGASPDPYVGETGINGNQDYTPAPLHPRTANDDNDVRESANRRSDEGSAHNPDASRPSGKTAGKGRPGQRGTVGEPSMTAASANASEPAGEDVSGLRNRNPRTKRRSAARGEEVADNNSSGARANRRMSNRDGSRASLSSALAQNDTDPSGRTAQSGSSGEKLPKSTSKKARQGSRNQAQDDSYLRQPVVEDDDDDMRDADEDDEGIARNTPTTGNKKKSGSEDEQKGKLLYIPPEAFPPVAGNTRSQAGKTQSVTSADKQGRTSTVDVSGEKFSGSDNDVAGAKFQSKPLSVDAANVPKKEVAVDPAQFRKKNAGAVTGEKFGRSGISVDSEVPTEAGKKIVLKGSLADETASTGSSADQNSLAAAFKNATTEETSNPTPSPGSGGGGGGGGATSPAKNGSKFRFDLGIKAGYERGFSNFTTNTFIISPYLQWNISTGFAFVLQPGFRYNQLTRNDITGTTASYHRITNAQVTQNHIYGTDSINGVITPTIQRNYTYTNTYDSIRVGASLKTKNFWEIELPILLRYKIASNFAVFGGLSLVFGNMIQMEETRETYSGFQKSGKLSFGEVDTAAPAPPVPTADQFFNYSTQDISAASANTLNPATNPVRLGLMFGFSYELQKRITLDVLYKQTISDMKYVPNEQIRKIYTQPYLRIMVGYKLFEGGKQDNVVKNPAGL